MSILFKFDDGDFKELPTFTAVLRVAINRVRISKLPIKITYYVDDVEPAVIVSHTLVFLDSKNNNEIIVKHID